MRPSSLRSIAVAMAAVGCAVQGAGQNAGGGSGGSGGGLHAGSGTREPPAVDPNAEAAKGVTDPRLRDVVFRSWETYLRRHPIEATRIGDHRFDDKLPDMSKAAIARSAEEDLGFMYEARSIPLDSLSPADQVTAKLFIAMMESSIESEPCLFEEWAVSASSNPVSQLSEIAEIHVVKTPEDGARLLSRYRGAGTLVDQWIANDKRGAEKGAYASAESLKRVIVMTEKVLAQRPSEWALAEPASRSHEGWSEADAGAFKKDLLKTLEGDVKPAFERWLAFMKEDLLPKARPDDRVGLAALPFGKVCYKARVKAFTTLPLTPEELHRKGREEIERINLEMQTLGMKVFGTDDLSKILDRLRSDKSLYFKSEKEIEEKAQHALDAARSRIKDYFGLLPKADCVVARVPDYEAPFTTIAYYRPPQPDGKPGKYFVNVYEPTTRPKYEAEALAFHESIPGHHLQIAIAQELPELPSFRKYLGMTAFVEGWGLYAERLADEMGLYSSDLDRMGMLSYDAWRASRLVVDTGIHAMGWSRAAATGFMIGHTGLAPNNIDNEVDRYIGWPGQALAYKAGQLEIWKLRHEAEASLGAAFRIKDFHDAVLSHGGLSLPLLRAQVGAWIASVKR